MVEPNVPSMVVSNWCRCGCSCTCSYGDEASRASQFRLRPTRFTHPSSACSRCCVLVHNADLQGNRLPTHTFTPSNPSWRRARSSQPCCGQWTPGRIGRWNRSSNEDQSEPWPWIRTSGPHCLRERSSLRNWSLGVSPRHHWLLNDSARDQHHRPVANRECADSDPAFLHHLDGSEQRLSGKSSPPAFHRKHHYANESDTRSVSQSEVPGLRAPLSVGSERTCPRSRPETH